MLEAAPDAPPELRAAGLRALGGALDIVGDVRARSAVLSRRASSCSSAWATDDEAAFLRFRVGANAVNRGETATGWPLIEASLEDFRRLGQPGA